MLEELEIEVSKKETKRFSASEKLLLRLCFVFVVLIISLFCFSNKAYKSLEESQDTISKVSTQITEQIALMDRDLNHIDLRTQEYLRMIENVKSLTEIEEDSQKNRVIPKDAIPNMLNRILNVIPQQVKILSISNEEESKKIFIEVESEKYEQLGYFSSILKNENVLKNIKSTSGSKNGSLIRITIEGELP